jgi:hypothetical protein
MTDKMRCLKSVFFFAWWRGSRVYTATCALLSIKCEIVGITLSQVRAAWGNSRILKWKYFAKINYGPSRLRRQASVRSTVVATKSWQVRHMCPMSPGVCLGERRNRIVSEIKPRPDTLSPPGALFNQSSPL